MTARTLLGAWALLGLGGCLPSSVVAPEQRAANLGAPELEWRPYSGAALDGLWASILIEGDASLAVEQVYYVFSPDGSFTGAALLSGKPPAFQTLSGTWRIDAEGLHLADGAPPARIEEAPGHLRLSGPEGTVVLRRQLPH